MPFSKKIKKSSQKKKSTGNKAAKLKKSAKSGKSSNKIKSMKKKNSGKSKKIFKSFLKKKKEKNKVPKNTKSSKPLKVKKTKTKSVTLKPHKDQSGLEQKNIQKAQSKLQKMEQRKISELKKELNNLEEKIKEKVQIKDAEGRLYCQEEFCDQPAVSGDFCRYHYLALWKHFQVRKQLLQKDFLFKSIDELKKSFGNIALDFILSDCKNEKAFESATKEMLPVSGKDEDTPGIETNY